MVVDIESSGLNPFHDRLISIGAVAVSDGLIRFRDSFKVVLRQDRPSDPGNILVTASTARPKCRAATRRQGSSSS